jgi:toxin ParE1/3/4
MTRLLKRPEAESDLDEIWWYIAQDSPNNADRFLDRIQERCLALSGFPQMGANREELKKGLRSQPVGNYLIFYFPLEDGVDVVRVIHGSRDIDSLL